MEMAKSVTDTVCLYAYFVGFALCYERYDGGMRRPMRLYGRYGMVFLKFVINGL